MLNDQQRIAYGHEAVKHGTPDYGKNGDDVEGSHTDAVDTIANVLHYVFAESTEDSLDAREAYALSALGFAREHFAAELRGAL